MRALGAALRAQDDLDAAMRNLPAGAPHFHYRIGVGAAAADAAALCARAGPGGICVDDAVLAAAAGKLDFESEALGAVAPGSPLRGHAVTGALTGRVFRYKGWTTPGRRRASLLLAAALVAAVVAALRRRRLTGRAFDRGRRGLYDPHETMTEEAAMAGNGGNGKLRSAGCSAATTCLVSCIVRG